MLSPKIRINNPGFVTRVLHSEQPIAERFYDPWEWDHDLSSTFRSDPFHLSPNIAEIFHRGLVQGDFGNDARQRDVTAEVGRNGV